MSGDRSYASVPERITWTTGFRLPVDKVVLGALSTFANFETGKGARVRVNKLAARAELKKRTVQRALHRLEADGWIVAVRRQHKGATAWDIQVDRLATTWVAMKAVGVMPTFPQGDKFLSVTSGAQLNVTGDALLDVTNDAQDPFLNVTGDAQGPILDVTGDAQLNVTSGAQIPCTERSPVQATIGSPVEPNPSAPAVAGSGDDADDTHEEAGELPPWEEFNRARQSQTRPADVRAGHPDHRYAGLADDTRRRGDHPAAPAPGVPLRQGPDSSGPESDHRPRAPVGPTQPGLGLLADVNAPIAVTEDQHRRFMADLRSKVGLPTAADVDEEKTG
jgi:hypothetical protein